MKAKREPTGISICLGLERAAHIQASVQSLALFVAMLWGLVLGTVRELLREVVRGFQRIAKETNCSDNLSIRKNLFPGLLHQSLVGAALTSASCGTLRFATRPTSRR